MSLPDEAQLECTCKRIREMCDYLITETFQRFELCPILTLPNIAIDYCKCHETVETYLESFQKGAQIVWKDINRCAPQEVEKTMVLIGEAENRLNEELNKDVSSYGKVLDEVVDERPMSQDTETSRITKEFEFTHKIATIFKFDGKGLHVGRMFKNCAVTIERGQLLVLTLDNRYQYCSTKDIIYVSNLCHFPRFEIGMFIQIGEDVTLKLLKQIDMHLTCCVQVGGVVKSYTDVFIEGFEPEKLLPCLTDRDQGNCHLALKHKVAAVVLAHPHTACYVTQVRRFFCHHDNECRINILVEFDEEVYLGAGSCERNIILESLKAADGVYLSKPLMTVLDDVLPFLCRKIIISNYVPQTDACYNGANTLLPTCFLMTRNRRGSFSSQFASFSSMINSVHRSAMDHCQCEVEVESDDAKALISITSSGSKAIELSCARRPFPILAITDDELTCKELHLYKGIKPLYYDWKQLIGRSDKSTIKYLLRLSVAYARHLCLLDRKFCIKSYELGDDDTSSTTLIDNNNNIVRSH